MEIRSIRWASPRLMATTLLVLIGFVILYRSMPSDFFTHMVSSLCEWVASMGIWAPLILGLIDALGVAVCFPFTIAFELAAGFLFGVVAGSTVISIAKTVGATTALLLGRTFLKDWVQATLKGSPHFQEVYQSMSQDTLKLAIMLRLSPVPSWVNNYGLALTPISFKDFITATILAGLPGVIRNVYIGSLMKSLSSPASPDDLPVWVHWLMGGLTIIASILVTKYLYKYLKIAMKSPSDQIGKSNSAEDLENQNQPAERPAIGEAGANASAIYATPVPQSPSRQRLVL